MNVPSDRVPPQETAQTVTRLLLKTGSDDRTICFYPSLFQLLIQSDAEVQRVDLGYAGSRLLERLLREPGEVVPREELMGFAWPDRIVGQGSLNQQIYSLRQIFCDEKGREIIQTLPRRGYQFNPNYIRERDLAEVVPAAVAGPAAEPTEAVGPADAVAEADARRLEAEPVSAAPSIDDPAAAGAQDEPTAAPRPRKNHSGSRWTAAALFVITLLAGLGASAWMDTTDSELVTREVKHDEVTMQLMATEPAMLDMLERDSTPLLERVSAMSEGPVELTLGWHDDYFQLFCPQGSANANWLMFHRSQLQLIANEQLTQCL
ncbi:DNA-binding winged helix-turn-helix (wHTH) domain-containing protein [Halopseudomonas xinjiangensis]|uniref:DNA-binding winged helix-turn-helix (WHTH) domain-containing protein n=1 Tax=Halopseudomonas xinjiangensis TaxID=487184 RepID=A0A1H1YR05_9GAMM|nr:winged helix-turn-helix domain-containing protein [Halopseudomonas xinjiangensis]SDT23935.1 DNA-binding winged helix-turn-helix (wHTH) domain-containing protein [Halopseudomonas xinjiangensis]